MLYIMYNKYNKEMIAVAIWVDFESPIPIYQQIRTSIIKAISSGELKSGDVLPSIRQLGVDLGVNMHTVAKAYSLLKNDGYLIMDRRSTAKVSSNISLDDSAMEKIKSLITDAAIEAVGRNLSKDEFISICQEIFKLNGGV